MRAEIVRVYGKADSFDIELTKNGNKWEVDIPPDLTDGVYAVQLTAVNVLGETAHWVGELFMSNGVCCLEIRGLKFWTRFDMKSYPASFKASLRAVINRPQQYTVTFRTTKAAELKKSNRTSIYTAFLALRLDVGEAFTLRTEDLKTKQAKIETTRNLQAEYRSPLRVLLRKECSHAQK